MKKGMIQFVVVMFGVFVAVPSTAQSIYTKAMFQSGKGVVVAHTPKRVLGGPYSINRLKSGDRTKLGMKSSTSVVLKATYPAKLRIASYDIKWSVTSSKGKTYKARGKAPKFNLAVGEYKVKMVIQDLVRSRTIRVRTSRNSNVFPLAVNAGVLKTRVSSGKTLVKVRNSKGTVVARSSTGTISRLLPAGKYTIDSKARGRNKTVEVLKGQVVVARLKVPSARGTVEVRALKDGAPLLPKGAKIAIKNAKGKALHSVSRSTLRSTLDEGNYSATLTIKGVVKSHKKFRIVSKKTQTVTLKM